MIETRAEVHARGRLTNRELGDLLAKELEKVAQLCRKASRGDQEAQFTLYRDYWDMGHDHATYGLIVGAGGLAGAVIFPDAHSEE